MLRSWQRGRTWRAVVACAAAYALALNIILAGVLGASALGDPARGAFEICLSHDGGSDQGAPVNSGGGQLHCVLCLTGAQVPVLPAQASVVVASTAYATTPVSHRSDDRPPAAARDPAKPPTGPPHTA
jgi:hypothetical protein